VAELVEAFAHNRFLWYSKETSPNMGENVRSHSRAGFHLYPWVLASIIRSDSKGRLVPVKAISAAEDYCKLHGLRQYAKRG